MTGFCPNRGESTKIGQIWKAYTIKIKQCVGQENRQSRGDPGKIIVQMDMQKAHGMEYRDNQLT